MSWRRGVAMLLAHGVLLLCGAPVDGATPAPDEWPATIHTRLSARGKIVALTFDACEAGERMQLDAGIADYLVAQEIPFTIFAGGRFVRDNRDAISALSLHPFVAIENHSWSHPRDMRLLTDQEILDEVSRTQRIIAGVVGHAPKYFRFPGGHADERTVAVVASLGVQVVHWRWPEGDPDPHIDADMLVQQTLERTRPGDILIFHINGRGWHTAEALPHVVEGLRSRGFRFVSLDEGFGLTPTSPASVPAIQSPRP